MALIQSTRATTGGGGGGNIAGWQIDEFERTTPFSSGLLLPLSQTPFDPNSIVLYSEANPTVFGDNWTYDSGTNSIEILFSGNPATDTDDGIWHFQIQYPHT